MRPGSVKEAGRASAPMNFAITEPCQMEVMSQDDGKEERLQCGAGGGAGSAVGQAPGTDR